MPGERGAQRKILVAALAVAVLLSLVEIWRLATHRIVFGSPEGGWVYPYIQGMTAGAWLAIMAALGLALALLRFTAGLSEKHEPVSVLAWLIAGLAIQFLLHSGPPAALEAIVTSDRANGFYSPTLLHGPLEFIRNHAAIAPTLPRHARSNMPGKVIFYYVLELFAASPRALGLLTIAFSNLGGLLLYQTVKDLFRDRRSALFAMALYMVIPGKLVFFPVLNTVSPVFILLPLWLLTRFLRTGRIPYAVLLGLSCYVLIFFEPLPLVLGMSCAALLGGALADRTLALRGAGKLLLAATAAFAAAHTAMLLLFRYDIIRDFLRVLDAAREFNVRAGRPYGLWVVQNLYDFSFCVGTAAALIVIAAVIDLVRGGSGPALRERLREPAALLTLSLVGALVLLDLAGINRGEVIRLWIFLACGLQMVAAAFCARLPGLLPFGALLACTIIQAGVASRLVGFVLP